MEARLTTTNVVVGSVDFKERFVYLASTIHRRYSAIYMYIYIYIERTQWQCMYEIESTTKNVDRVSGHEIQLQKPSGTKCVCVCVCVCAVPGARLLTTFSSDLRHALHL